MPREEGRYKILTRRAALLAGGQIALFGALAARMYVLQVVEADRYTVLAEENRINLRLLAPRRGRIVDRFGVPLANNQQNYRVVIVAEQAGEIESTLNAIGTLIVLTDTERRRVLRELKRKHSFVPVIVRDNISWDEMSRIEVNAPELPGVSIESGFTRSYPFSDRTSHVVGYVAAVSEKELTGDPLLELPDFRIGKNGIEKALDHELRGTAGASQIEVNAVGRVVREISRNDGTPGKQVALSLDMWLQDFTYRRIASEPSATVVVLDAETGEVLVMASSPGYDNNAFNQGLSGTMWQSLTNDPRGPLINKTIQGVYPPGSTFKPCVAMAALESGLITPDFQVTCTGSIPVGDSFMHCYWKPGHGTLDLHHGLKLSCDVYFYTLAHMLGVDRIAAMAKKLGLGELTGIDIPNERTGLIPTKAWKLAALGVRWQGGEDYSVGIGQGFVSTTPLQLAVMLSRLVTNRAIVPRLVREAGVMEPGQPIPAREPEFEPLGLDPKHIAAVLGGMDAVCNEPGGTAYGARITQPGMAMGGKSGTAQFRHISQAERERGLKKGEQLPWAEREHALFIAFAPVGNPRYVCSVFIEHGIAGGKYAGPIARDVLRECQRRDPARQVPNEPLIIADATALLSPGQPKAPEP